jgi:hypothetical protein
MLKAFARVGIAILLPATAPAEQRQFFVLGHPWMGR